MARLRIEDMLTSHSFWLTTVTPFPSYGFIPTLGFSSITAPRVSLEMEEIYDGNALFKKKVVSGNLTADNLTLTRGVKVYDSDFWFWIVNAARGMDSPRRDALLVHLAPLVNISIPMPLKFGPHDLSYVPARFWLLQGCFPVSYKTGSDFDALTSNVSVAELELAVESFEEINITTALRGRL